MFFKLILNMSPYKNTGTNETSEGMVDVPRKKIYVKFACLSVCLFVFNKLQNSYNQIKLFCCNSQAPRIT